ncbi:MAG: hypothetical protein AAGK28_06865 [Pseudomonadota bacterium]
MGDVGAKADELSALLQERLRFRARDLHHALRKAGRRVPRRLRVEGEYIALAQHMELTPKLAKQIDMARVEAGHRNLKLFVEEINPMDRVIGGILSILGPLAFGLIVLFAVSLVVLRWRGLI